MQRIRAFDRKRIVIFIIIPIILFAVLVALDQISKYLAVTYIGIGNSIKVIENFFSLSCSTNTGAGFSFLADKEWAQTLFMIITPVALVGFIIFYFFAVKNNYKWLTVTLTVIVAGTVGNYIDRILNGQVVDFLSFKFGDYYFPTFNVADICLTVGVIMLIAHFVFLDGNALFRKKAQAETDENDTEDNEDA